MPRPVAHSQSQRQKPRDIVISLDLLDVIMKDDFSVSVHTCIGGNHSVTMAWEKKAISAEQPVIALDLELGCVRSVESTMIVDTVRAHTFDRSQG